MSIKESIGWARRSLNIVTGCWGPGGSKEKPKRCFDGSCYAERMAKRLKGRFEYPINDPFKPTYHFNVMKPNSNRNPFNWKTPSIIFVSSMGDLFGDWVPEQWINYHIEIAEALPRHRFMFLTKNPTRYLRFNFPANCWLGTTVTKHEEWKRIAHLVKKCATNKTFISFEPLLGDVNKKHIWNYAKMCDQVIVGRMTHCKRGDYIPDPTWIVDIMSNCRKHDIQVFLKNNLIPIMGKEVVEKFQCKK